MAKSLYAMLNRGDSLAPELLIADGSYTRDAEILKSNGLLGSLGLVKCYFEQNKYDISDNRISRRFNVVECPMSDSTWIQTLESGDRKPETYSLEKLISFN